MEVCSRILSRYNEVTVRWVPAHTGITGSEKADENSKATVEGASYNEVLDEYWWETSFAHMTRAATEARSRTTSEWISNRFRAERRYRPPAGKGLRQQQLRRSRKSVIGRYYQLLSGHTAIGSYLHDKIHKIDTDECWWCGSGERQSRHHHFRSCRAWARQAREMWKDIGKACGWKHPRAPSVRLLWKEKATDAVLAFLRDTRVGCMVTLRPQEEGEDSEGEEGGRGPP